jgi:F-type H+-transporting ATPase subunit alpha
MKQVAGRLRLELAQYRELAAFAQFGTSELDRATRMQLERGMRLTEILKQPQWAPLPLEKEVTILYAAVNGFVDDVPVEALGRWEEQLHRFMETHHPEIGQAIAAEKEISEKTEAALRDALNEFKQTAAL